ncbi:unnamed protein product [Peniophora sp. CBMAI 1063]|nr:unnamed protein product [Peniophora sp. CBMAI 1063]
MLDFAPTGNYDGAVLYSTNHAAYPPVAQSPQAHLLPFPAKKSPQSSPQYSPASVHGFDPFAEDSSDDTASSSGSDVSRASSLADFSRQRDQDYRVAAWVNYGSSCAYNPASLLPQPSPYQPSLYTPMSGNTHYHSRTSSSSSASSSRSAFSVDDEPYVIYSTPLPGAPPAPAPAAPPAPAAHVLGPIAPPRRQHGQAKSLSVPGPVSTPRVQSSGVPIHLPHRRYVSLCSIREEDETRM